MIKLALSYLAGSPVRGSVSQQTSTLLWLSLMVLLWGLSWPVVKIMLLTMPPMWLAALRFASAGACLFGFLALRRQLHFPARADWPIVLSVGLLQMMAFTGLGMIAMTHTDTSRAVLLAYTTPLWGVLLSWLLLKRVPTVLQLLALLIGLCGIGIIISPLEMDWHSNGAVLGAVLLIIGSVLWTIAIMHINKHQWQASPLALAPWQMLLATLPLAVIAWLTEGSPLTLPMTPNLLAMLIFIGPIATSFCFVIAADYGRRISTYGMSNLLLGVPLVGIISSVLLLHNVLSMVFIAGLLLIICGMLLAGYATHRQRPQVSLQ